MRVTTFDLLIVGVVGCFIASATFLNQLHVGTMAKIVIGRIEQRLLEDALAEPPVIKPVQVNPYSRRASPTAPSYGCEERLTSSAVCLYIGECLHVCGGDPR